MSLFPAYASTSTNVDASEQNSNPQEWLKLSSYQVNADVINKVPDANDQVSKNQTRRSNSTEGSENSEGFDTKKQKKEQIKRTRKKKRSVELQVEDVCDDFKIDKTRINEYFSVDTISRPSVPRYYRKLYIFKGTRRSHRRKFKRYYDIKNKAKEGSASEDDTKITRKDLSKEVNKVEDENFTGFKQEESMMQKTAFYNRNLAEDPSNVDMWLKYVEFQDTVYHFEKTYRKGSVAKGLRVTAERKLAILDKALTHNSNNERLLRERLNVAVSVYPADELNAQLEKLVEKEQGNIILWQGYIESRQCSMSHCNTPAVLNLYTKCLSILHKLRRSAKLEKSVLEENILRMLYQCGLFLKQSGLFEQLWTLLKLYLELNLSPDKSKFNVAANFAENQLVELEDVVLNSQLPIHELWLRIEKLRESCHWLPYTGGGNCEDPQRLVFSDDVAELIHPITMPGNTFKLTATILTLLKIPLLPCRHTTMKNLGSDYVPWALDSVESLLPIFFNLYPIDLSNKHLINYSHRLAVGPQYLKILPGQEEYLNFVLHTIRSCVECLSGYEKNAVSIWWFRFQRLLINLDKEGHFKMSSAVRKKIKSDAKELLKLESSNIILYSEYALIEKELGHVDSAINILLKAINTSYNNKAVDSLDDDDMKSTLCYAFRTLIELNLNTCEPINTKEKALSYLVALALGKNLSQDLVSHESLRQATLKFKHVTSLLIQQKETSPLSTVEHFLPNFQTDWIICNGWFLYLTRGPIECGTFIENILTSFEESPDKTWEIEILFEFYVAVLFKTCIETPGAGTYKLLDDALYRGIKAYPNNLFLLSVLAKEQSLNCCLGQPFWKIRSLLMKTGHALPNLFLILISSQRINQIQEKCIDTFTGQHMTVENGLKNRMLSLFRSLTAPDMCTRRCGLVWRLYLQFVHEHFDPKTCRNAYYSAVEECPWLKALYIDAAIYIPAELPQIQDLLIEKQLRLHVTPEELDILRN